MPSSSPSLPARTDDGPDFLRGLVWSVFAALFAAGFLIPYRFAVEASPRFTAMTAMFVVAALFNGGVNVAQSAAPGRARAVETKGGRWRLDRITWMTAAALTACTVFCNFGIAWALPDIGAGMTSVVLKSQVVLTPILAMWLLGERVSGRFWIGGTVALFGVALPAVTEGGGLEASAGYAWAFGAAVGFALMQIVTRKVIARIEPAFVNALRLVMSALVMQLLADGRAAWSMPLSLWLYAAAAGVLGPGLSRLSLMMSVRYVSPSVNALVALIGPVFAFALGAAFFDERPSAAELAGAALILAGVLWPLIPPLFAAVSGRSDRLVANRP